MAKSIIVKQKKRGRPATGQLPLMGFRATDKLRASIVRWAEYQPDKPKLSEALRRLVELGLTVKGRPKQSSDSQKTRAKDLAGKTIDKLTEAAATPDDKAVRKRRLLHGPSAFRDSRLDHPKKK